MLSGPSALTLDIFSYFSCGGFGLGVCLKLFKIFTIPCIKGIINGAINIVHIVIPPFLAILALIFILSMWALVFLRNIEDFWADFNLSVYTFF